jgi:hypothetical protein
MRSLFSAVLMGVSALALAACTGGNTKSSSSLVVSSSLTESSSAPSSRSSSLAVSSLAISSVAVSSAVVSSVVLSSSLVSSSSRAPSSSSQPVLPASSSLAPSSRSAISSSSSVIRSSSLSSSSRPLSSSSRLSSSSSVRSSVQSSSVQSSSSVATGPFLDTRNSAAVMVPARIESEDYSRAQDNDQQNTGSCTAAGPVDYIPVQPEQPGDCDVANTEVGEWLEYKIAATAGDYDLDFSFASGTTGTRQAEVLLNGKSLGILAIPVNGSTTYGMVSLNKIALPQGESTLRVVMTTGSVRFDAIDVSRHQTVPTAPTVTSFSIINTRTNQAVSGYEELLAGQAVALNLDTVGHNDLVLRANVAGNVKSVYFGLNTRTKYFLDDTAPYAIYPDSNGTFRRWTLGAGVFTLSAAAYADKTAQTAPGASISIKLTLQESVFDIADRSVDLIGKVGGAAPSVDWVLKNIGNVAGGFQLLNAPSWVTLSATQGTIAPAASQTVQWRTAACTAEGVKTAVVNLRDASGDVTPITLRQACTAGNLQDVAFDRFYINQAVPAQDTFEPAATQTPLVKGRKGLARVFVTANQANIGNIKAKLFYKKANGDTGSLDLTGPTTVPTLVNEGMLAQTYNVIVPEDLVAPGLEIYIQVDSTNALAEANETNNRYPAEGYAKLVVQDPPRFDMTFVPVIIDGTDPGLNNTVIEDLLKDTLKLHPIENYNFTIRTEPYTYTGNESGVKSWGHALGKIQELRTLDRSARYYHGLVGKRVDASGTAGIAYLSSKAALSIKSPGTIAHEFGHNFSLSHTDCGGPLRPDNRYPFYNAVTNIWGYDILTNMLTPPTSKDLMSYCSNEWASHYGYNKVMKYRGLEGSGLKPYAEQEDIPVTWLTGVIDSPNEARRIRLSNVYAGYGTLEDGAGDYSLSAYDEAGLLVYFTAFNALMVDHADEAHFSVPLPNLPMARLEIRRGDELMLAMPWGSSTAAQQKAQAPIIAVRESAEVVHIRWGAAPLHSLTVRDAATGAVLTNDQTGDARIATQASTLAVTLVGPGITRNLTIDVH